MSLALLLLTLGFSIGFLGKAADVLVEHAVHLAHTLRLPKAVVGATLVSLGTTTPEAAVSVLAAYQGTPGLALGNAIGSVICDSGLVLGIACLIGNMRFDAQAISKQSYIQTFAGFLIIGLILPWTNLPSAFSVGGTLTQNTGFFLLFLLALYMIMSVYWGRSSAIEEADEDEEIPAWPKSIILVTLSIAIVIISSEFLIASATELAVRAEIPESVIAATLVAFGTSLPELVTAITAVRRNQGDIALGNVVGADILNILFVAGASSAVTEKGLFADPIFFKLHFPVMMVLLITIRLGVWKLNGFMPKWFGGVLVALYLAATAGGYFF